MATVLRSPLVSDRQRKRGNIPPLDLPRRPLTVQAGDVYIRVPGQQLSDSAPPIQRILAPDVYRTRSLSLIAGDVYRLTPGKVLTDSAPIQKINIAAAFQFTHPYILDVPVTPADTTTKIRPAIVSQAQQKKNIGLGVPEVPPRSLALLAAVTEPTKPPGKALFDSAPKMRWQGFGMEVSGGFMWDNSPNYTIQQLSQSAPPPKFQVFADQYPNRLTTWAEPLPPYAMPLLSVRISDSAPWIKTQVRIEALYRPLTLGVNPQPVIRQLSDSAPPPKAQSWQHEYPNLSTGTLAPTVPLPLLAVEWSWSAPPPKVPVYFEIPQNTVARQPVPQIVFNSDSAPFPGRKQAWVEIPPSPAGTLFYVSDTVPESLGFVDQTGVELATEITSAPIFVSGINEPTTISVSGGEYSINGAPFTSAEGVVVYGDAIRARHTSALTYGTTTDTVITIGGVSDTWTTTTEALFVEVILEEVPYLIGDLQAQAEQRIGSIHCVAEVVGTSGTVTSQIPEAFTFVERGTTITVTLGGPINSGQRRRRRRPPYNSRIH